MRSRVGPEETTEVDLSWSKHEKKLGVGNVMSSASIESVAVSCRPPPARLPDEQLLSIAAEAHTSKRSPHLQKVYNYNRSTSSTPSERGYHNHTLR